MVKKQPATKTWNDAIRSVHSLVKRGVAPKFSQARVDNLLQFVNFLEALDPSFALMMGMEKKLIYVQDLELVDYSGIKSMKELLTYYNQCMAQLVSSRDFRNARKRGDEFTKGWGSLMPLSYSENYVACLSLLPALERVATFNPKSVHVLGDPEFVSLAYVAMGAKMEDCNITGYGAFATKRPGVTVKHEQPKEVPNGSLLISFLNYFNDQNAQTGGIEAEEATIVSIVRDLQPTLAIFSFHMPHDLASWLGRADTDPEHSAWSWLSKSYTLRVFKGNRVHNGYAFLVCTPLGTTRPDANVMAFLEDAVQLASQVYMTNVYRDFDISYGNLYPSYKQEGGPGIDHLKRLQTFIPYTVPKKMREVAEKAPKAVFTIPKSLEGLVLGNGALPTKPKETAPAPIVPPREVVVDVETMDSEGEVVNLSKKPKEKRKKLSPVTTPNDSEKEDAQRNISSRRTRSRKADDQETPTKEKRKPQTKSNGKSTSATKKL